MNSLSLKNDESPASAERRKSPRLRLQIPLFIRGTDASGTEFVDLTKTLDISATGAFLASPRPLRGDHLVMLTIPAPPPVSSTSSPPATPPIQARVRRQELSGNLHFVGVEFVTPLD
jgi:hypothetical protein